MKCAFRLRCEPPLIMLSRIATSDGEMKGWWLASENQNKKLDFCASCNLTKW